MYRTGLDTRDRSGAIFAVAAVHALLLFMLLHLSGKLTIPGADTALRVFDVNEVPPPIVEPIEQPKPERKPEPEKAKHQPSPKNIKAKPTEVAAPRPEVSLPVPVPLETSKTPAEETASTQGAATEAGRGPGAGGAGNGTGGGGSGSGSDGGYVVPPRLLTPVLRGRDFPRQLLDSWPRGAELFLRLRISPAGMVSQCIVDRGTGIQQIDSAVCSIVQQRFRYSPAHNSAGQAVAGWAGYRQVAPR